MNGANLLRRNKELAYWWVSVIHDDRFDQVIALARAEMAEEGLETEKLLGANHAFNLIQTMTDNADYANEFPSPGLDHRTLGEISKDRAVKPQP